MQQPEFRDTNFWIALHKRTGLDERIGIEECSFWCDEAQMLLSAFGRHKFKKIEGGVTMETIEKYRLSVNWHRVLARKYQEGVFIADGTAGQIHKDYPQGYYGYDRDAPQPLRLFYKSAIRIELF